MATAAALTVVFVLAMAYRVAFVRKGFRAIFGHRQPPA